MRHLVASKFSQKEHHMSDAPQQQQANPMEALQFLDGVLAGVAGSRKDHQSIQGALGIVAQALAPKPDIAPEA